MEYCINVGNQHVKQIRRGGGSLATDFNLDLKKVVDIKTTEKAGEAHVKMRNIERSTHLAEKYNLHKKERNRKLMFNFTDLLNAAIGMCPTPTCIYQP